MSARSVLSRSVSMLQGQDRNNRMVSFGLVIITVRLRFISEERCIPHLIPQEENVIRWGFHGAYQGLLDTFVFSGCEHYYTLRQSYRILLHTVDTA